ncbi:hypothetical protein B7P43_G18431 [Cryptotermes secundus]|uniref:Uncharacterized protein n=1 Tax=Cryptotermes secundus TaxID=105785 RepID=A0A2J7QWK0_9NEOP|nr:hypothetical protein B7P43_G18431 [Cryptotermes secundus]
MVFWLMTWLPKFSAGLLKPGAVCPLVTIYQATQCHNLGEQNKIFTIVKD